MRNAALALHLAQFVLAILIATWIGDPRGIAADAEANVDKPPKALRGTHEADNMPDDAKKLLGTWTVLMVTKDGRDISENNATEFAFSERELTITWPKEKGKSTYKLDTSRTPKAIQLDPIIEKGQYTAAARGVYELNNDTLKLALGPFKVRPTEISDKNQMLFILKRKNSTVKPQSQ